jgi:hypothetical protein
VSGILLRRKRVRAKIWMTVYGPITARRYKNSNCHHPHGCIYVPNLVRSVLAGVASGNDGIFTGIEDEEVHPYS